MTEHRPELFTTVCKDCGSHQTFFDTKPGRYALRVVCLGCGQWEYVSDQPTCPEHPDTTLRCPACLGGKGGKATTDAKRKAAQANGKKGGRPPKPR